MSPRQLIFVSAFLFFAIALAPLLPRARSAQETEPKAEWTLMMYMDADNDLEAAQMDDLKEMLAAGSSENVNIVVLADRHGGADGRKYSNAPVANLKAWTTAKLLYVKHNELEELADWGEVDMGD